MIAAAADRTGRQIVAAPPDDTRPDAKPEPMNTDAGDNSSGGSTTTTVAGGRREVRGDNAVGGHVVEIGRNRQGGLGWDIRPNGS